VYARFAARLAAHECLRVLRGQTDDAALARRCSCRASIAIGRLQDLLARMTHHAQFQIRWPALKARAFRSQRSLREP